MRHVHADLIHAWADGAEIQGWCPHSNTWKDLADPIWFLDTQYRIKPQNKVYYGTSNPNCSFLDLDKVQYPESQIKLTFKHDTNKIIAVELL